MGSKQNGVSKDVQGTLVLDGYTPEDVARAMIGGRQREPFHLLDMDEVCRRLDHFRQCLPRVGIFYGAIDVDGYTPEDVARAMIGVRQREPFHLLNMDEVCRRLDHFRQCLPRVGIFYAMKANDWEPILKFVISQNIGFDCASPGEIYKVIKLGASPTSIVFALPTKTPYQMTYAREAGVKHTTFDSSYELKKIKQYWPDAHLLIRIRVDGECIYKLGDKFGCDFETEAVDLLEEAASLGLKVVGVAFHVGSACSSEDSHAIGLQRARKLFDHEARAGRQMKIVDIGGGFMSDRTDRLDKVAQLINTALEKYFPEPNVMVIAEPGRYVVDSAANLYNSINNIRRVTKNNKPVNMFYLNDGFHGSIRYAEYWTTVEKFSIGQKNGVEIEEEFEEAILWGPTCDSADRIMENVTLRLPKCSPIDWLVFKIQGAYTYVFHGPFSSIEIPKMRAVVSLELWKRIKDRPVFTPEDFVVNPDISAPLPSTLPPPIRRDQLNAFHNTSLLDKV